MTTKILVLLALLSVGTFSAVYAETATVEVPFDSHGQSCSFDELAVEFHCVWQGMIPRLFMVSVLVGEGCNFLSTIVPILDHMNHWHFQQFLLCH